MAVDYQDLAANLKRFYDFSDKVVLFVGAGARQLLDPSIPTRKLIAIDRNTESLDELRNNVAAAGKHDSVDVVDSRFEDIHMLGDVVYFEFCLHEMDDPEKALSHARTLAPDIVVFDHSPQSEWVFLAAEDEQVLRSNQALERFGVRQRQTYIAEQRFRDYGDLVAKIRGQSPVAVQRAEPFAGATNIVIPMRYQLILL
jgi:ubiquinone/menaquinone biosynthesis C-methylase UbiE